MRSRGGELRPHRHQEARPLQRVRATGCSTAVAGRFETAPATSTCTSASTTTAVIAYAELLAGRARADTAIAFLRGALADFAARGVALRARPHRQRRRLPLRALPRTTASRSGFATLAHDHDRPRTNGKAERFIQTLLTEWAYARLYSNQRRARRRATALARPLQLQTTTRQPQPASVARLQPLGAERRAQVDVDLPERTRARVDEPWAGRLDDDDVAGADIERCPRPRTSPRPPA